MQTLASCFLAVDKVDLLFVLSAVTPTPTACSFSMLRTCQLAVVHGQHIGFLGTDLSHGQSTERLVSEAYIMQSECYLIERVQTS